MMYLKQLNFVASILVLGGLGVSASFAQDEDVKRYQGYVEGEYTWIALPAGGQITKLNVARGDQVTKGQLLYSLDDVLEVSELKLAEGSVLDAEVNIANLTKGLRPTEIAEIIARIDEQKALVQFYETDFNREVELSKTGASSKEKFDRAKAQLDAARSGLRASEAKLATAKLGARSDDIIRAEIKKGAAGVRVVEAQWRVDQRTAKAPVDAVVFDTFYRVGEFADKGKPVVSLLAPENIKVRFFVSETIVSTLNAGDGVALSCDSCPPNLSGSISYISPKAEYTPPVIYSEDVRSKLVFMIEARITGDLSPFKPGLPIDVALSGKGSK